MTRLEFRGSSSDLLNRLVICSRCQTQGLAALRYLPWADLPYYLRGVFDPDWICNPCIEQEKEKYWAIRRRAEGAQRRAAERQAMPAWADRKAIAEIYAEAERMTRATGIPHHVDHQVPLVSPLVCGLHVENNLEVIPAIDNLRKGNRFNGQNAKRKPSRPEVSGYLETVSPRKRQQNQWNARKTDLRPRLVKGRGER